MLKMIMMGFMNCDEAGRSLSDKQDQSLPALKGFRLWIHLMSCKLCKGYERYLIKLRLFSKKIGGLDHLSKMDEKLSPEIRQKIQKDLQKPN